MPASVKGEGDREVDRARDGAAGGREPGAAGPIQACPEGASVRLRVVPGARRTELVGTAGGALRLRVAAPPVEGKANEAVLAFLAAALGTRARALRLAAGERGRDKVVVVPGMTPAAVAAALGVAPGSGDGSGDGPEGGSQDGSGDPAGRA
jgi:uncharacterized protein (TIGR00251 family)